LTLSVSLWAALTGNVLGKILDVNIPLRIILFVLLAGLATAQNGPSKDREAIRQRLSSYAEARDRNDMQAEMTAYAQDADFRVFGGAIARGRPAIEKLITVSDPTYRFALKIDDIHVLGRDAAVVETSIVAGPAARQISIIGTYVMTKQHGQWLIGAARVSPKTNVAAAK
jgi:uncharacterized protein (TIGR02246 family)